LLHLAGLMVPTAKLAIPRKDHEHHEVVMSVKSSLAEGCTAMASTFLLVMQNHVVFGSYHVFWPNNYGKSWCKIGSGSTDLDGHCLGKCCKRTFDSKNCSIGSEPEMACEAVSSLVTDPSCWAFEFRSYLERVEPVRGVMIQLCECPDPHTGGEQFLGDGQRIEATMAQDVGVKVFRVEVTGWAECMWASLDVLVERLEKWRADGSKDIDNIDIISIADCWAQRDKFEYPAFFGPPYTQYPLRRK